MPLIRWIPNTAEVFLLDIRKGRIVLSVRKGVVSWDMMIK